MYNKKWTIITYLMIVFIAMIGLISFGIRIYRAERQLEATKADLEQAKIELAQTNESLCGEIEQNDKLSKDYEDLRAQLETANTIIASLKSEEYIVGATVTQTEIDMLAKTVWGEARGCNRFEQSAVVWCILNRVDAGRGTIAEVITAPGQFHGYSKNFPVTDSIRELCEDVVLRWQLEKVGVGNVGRTLPSDYLYFWADSTGIGNVFRNKFKGNYTKWNWDCWNPYE